MRKLILSSVIQHLLYYMISVKSLIGRNFTPIRGGEFPSAASFQYFPDRIHFCGGALFTEKHVITSEICLRDLPRERYRVVFEVAHTVEPVVYTVASVTTYSDWFASRNQLGYNGHGMAIVTLDDIVHHVRPVNFNGLKRRELDGQQAIMIGWRNNVLSKAAVNLLSEQDSDRQASVIRNVTHIFSDEYLYTSAKPFALLEIDDFGSPLFHARDKSLLGIACKWIPSGKFDNANFTTEFIRQHQVNLYFSVDYYRYFINSTIPAIPGA